jgi:hypothetical protein
MEVVADHSELLDRGRIGYALHLEVPAKMAFVLFRIDKILSRKTKNTIKW